MLASRRDFLKSVGVVIVSFGANTLAPEWTSAQGPFSTHPSHIDPKQLDSWLAVSADGTVTVCTGKCDFGQALGRLPSKRLSILSWNYHDFWQLSISPTCLAHS